MTVPAIFLLLALLLSGVLCLRLRAARADLAAAEAREQNLAAAIDAASHAASRASARTSAILTAALDCIVTVDSRGRITEWNPACVRTFGWTREEALGQMLGALLLPDSARAAHDAAMSRYRPGAPSAVIGQRIEVTAMCKDGREIPVELAIHEVRSDGEVFFTGYLRDISGRRRAEAELLAAKEDAEAANHAKSAFLAVMSHEIRTPMNAVLGLLELLSLTRIDREQRDTVNLAMDSSRSLLRLIDDILDFSKIEAGKLDLQDENVELRALVGEVARVHDALAATNGLNLVTEIDPAVPAYLRLDPLRFRQVLGNFLSNAIKFSRDGIVRIVVGADGGDEDSPERRLVVSAIDQGLGMAPETLRLIGEPFMQANTATRRFGGTGLGLAICKRLAELMRGTLYVESEPGRGTTATLAIPLYEAAGETVTQRYSSTQGLRVARGARNCFDGAPVLVVDDHPTNRRLVTAQLAWLGCEAAAAEDGRAALQLIEAATDGGSPFAAVITDCQMPGMDGYELTAAIRRLQAERGWPHQPVLAFTASTLAEARDECLLAGMDDVLVKPVEIDVLRTKLAPWIDGRTHVGSAAAAPNASAQTAAAATQFEFLNAWEAALLEEFRSSHQIDMAALQAAIAAHDGVAVARAAHRIKGATRMLGSMTLSGIAAAIERSVSDGAWGALDGHVRALEHETAALCTAMTARGAARKAS